MTNETKAAATPEVATKLYELGIIFPGNLSDSENKTIMTTVEKEIKTLGGTIKTTQDWGKRQLAYKIDGYEQGYYAFYFIDLPTDKAAELDNFCRLEKDLIRFMLSIFPEDVEIADYSDAPAPYGLRPKNLIEDEEDEDDEIEVTETIEEDDDTVTVTEDIKETITDKKTGETATVEEKIEVTADKETGEVVSATETIEVKDEKKLDKILDDLDGDLL